MCNSKLKFICDKYVQRIDLFFYIEKSLILLLLIMIVILMTQMCNLVGYVSHILSAILKSSFTYVSNGRLC